VHPRNPERDLPTIQGEVVVMEAATGRRLGILDGSALTARRTAALSLLAARELAPHPEGPLLIVGAGTQGRAHLEAFREGLGIARVFITSRTAKRAASLGKHAEDLGVEARVIEDPKEILDEVSLVVTATTSREPVLPGEVPDGIFVAAVGSFEPEAAELPAELVSRSSVVVDTLEGAREEAGDLIQAERFGAFEWNSATSLEDALRASVRPKGTVVFKSVGHALWDLAAARTVFSGRSRG
jgi:1-piperideine-2-carboxylate/1-pyrroline-2-carboxylate reductase [NAD(P)H]